MDKADIIIEDGKIVQVGAELEVPSGNCTLHVCKNKKNYLYATSMCNCIRHNKIYNNCLF